MRVNLNISLFSYLNRPIFDVRMNETDFMLAQPHTFDGTNAVIVGQEIMLGPQKVSWRLDGAPGTARNGETVMAKNTPLLDKVPSDIKWLALHIFDDDTVEIKLSKGTPAELQSERGLKFIQAWDAKHGK